MHRVNEILKDVSEGRFTHVPCTERLIGKSVNNIKYLSISDEPILMGRYFTKTAKEVTRVHFHKMCP